MWRAIAHVGRLGVVGVELVEVHVSADRRRRGVLVRGDLGEAGDGGRGDVPDVDEVAPVPQGLGRARATGG